MNMLKVSSVQFIFALYLMGTCSTSGGSNTGSEAAEPEGTYVFQYQVIAEGGLRLRSRPTVDSEVIEVIPRWTFFDVAPKKSFAPPPNDLDIQSRSCWPLHRDVLDLR